jgi:hypothetical protein
VTYRSLAYPSDVLYELGIDSRQVPDAQRFCEFDPGTPYESPGPADRETNEPYRPNGDFLLLNFCQQFTSGRLPAPDEPDDRALLYDGRHWLSYPAYTYDGFLPETRRDLQADPPRVRVYGAAGSSAERRR